MSLFCIPKHLVEELKKSALKGEVDLKNLMEMSSEGRRDFFTKQTSPELGKFINTKFEQALISNQKGALLEWAQSVFTPEAQSKPVYKNILDKINALDELGVLTPKTKEAFLADLVSDKLGISVTPEQTKIISDRAKKIDESQKSLGKELGNPAKEKENLEFFKAKKEMDDYLNGLTPASNVRVLTSTIGRGMMLASVKSPILNIGSNIELALTESISRRINEGSIKGTDTKLAVDYVKFVNKVYQETGYDISRMIDLSDSGVSGGRVLGETGHSQGGGGLRKVGRAVEDVVFKQLMGAPDVAFSSAHFADSANIGALKLAEGNVARAKEIMTDAMRIEPQTAEGEIIRSQAILDAQVATWTNSTWASKASESIRKILNDVTGEARAGDYLLPFVKTPANVIATGIDYAGGGIPKALFKTIKAWRAGEMGSKAHIKSMTRDLVRSGLGITGAAIIAAQLDVDDFVGAYDPQRAQIEALRNSTENSFRIGDKWVSTNWLGPLAVPFTAMMYARKYGNTKGEMAYQYAMGVIDSGKEIPGLKDGFDYVKSEAYKKNQSLEEMTGEAKGYIAEQAFSRLVPGIMSDIAKATDKTERQTTGSTKGVPNVVINKIPGARQSLPVKTDIFGKVVVGEPGWSDILFGSRVKTNKETAVIGEINKISDESGKNINFTNWEKSSSKTLGQFKEKVGPEKYEQAKNAYGVELEKQLTELFKKPSYKKLSPEDKARAIGNQDAQAQEKILKKYNFTYKEDKKKKVSNL